MNYLILDYVVILLLLICSRVINKRIFIIASPYGRWGNRLMLYSYVISWSKKFKGIVLNPSFNEYKDYFLNFKNNVFGLIPSKIHSSYNFPISVSNIINNSFERISYRKIRIPGIISFDLESVNGDYDNKSFQNLLCHNNVIFFRGFLFGKRNFKLVSDQRDYLKMVFKFSDNIVEQSNEILDSIDKSLVVGVCMRQGDYKYHFGGKLYLEDHEYRVLIHRIKKMFGNDFGIFVACEEKKVRAIDESAYFNYEDPAVNICTLSKCNYLIGPASTFMTWAAFLNNVPTCYIDRTNYNSKDLVFKEVNF